MTTGSKIDQPLVSVIIPTHDRLKMLLEAIESVQAQTYVPTELIVVDDGSTDGTAELVRNQHGVNLLQISHTGCPGAVRNAGMDIAKGDYLAFLDSDDLWMPGKLSAQMEILLACPDVPLVHCREIWIRDGKPVSQASQRHQREGQLFPDAVHKCVIGPSTVVLHRSILSAAGRFREDLEIAEDYELWLRVTALFQVAYCDQALVTKRAGHGDQLSERHGQIERFRIAALAPLVATRRWAEPKQSIAQRELARKCLIYAAGARKRGRDSEADRYEALAAGSSADTLARNDSISSASSGF